MRHPGCFGLETRATHVRHTRDTITKYTLREKRLGRDRSFVLHSSLSFFVRYTRASGRECTSRVSNNRLAHNEVFINYVEIIMIHV